MDMLYHMEEMFADVRNYILREGYRHVAVVRANPKATDISREFDIGAENAAIEYCRSRKLPVKILTEEQGEVDLASGAPEYVLVLDPVDGSTNLRRYIEGSAFSAACIPYSSGHIKPKDVEHALIGSMMTGALVKGSKGRGVVYKGPFSGGEEAVAKPSTNNDLGRAIVEIDLDFGLDESKGVTIEKPHMSRVLRLMQTTIKNIRRNGSAALGLSYVPIGAVDAYIDVRNISTPENWMAAYLLVNEAGGIFTDPFGIDTGEVDMLQPYSYIASGNEDLHRKILESLDMEM